MRQNISLAVIVDSSQTNTYSVLGETMFSAFEHFGMPYQIFDLAKDAFSYKNLSSYSAIIIAQEGSGGVFSSSEIERLFQVVSEGAGLVSFDCKISEYPAAYRQMSGIGNQLGNSETDEIKIVSNKHYITKTKKVGERIGFFRSVTFQKAQGFDGSTLLATPNGDPLILTFNYGSGRIVQFLLSPGVWLKKYLGHTNGLDDIFWKSVVWAARKPFLMKAMPPFVTARIDDASGSSSSFGKKKNSANQHFHYLDSLNKHGYIPNIGLFIEDVSDGDARVIKSKYEAKLAEFSSHAFTDSENIADRLIYMKHDGTEFTEEELEKNFAMVDGKFLKWGIKHSKALNAHFGEVGVSAIPFLKKRGQTLCMDAMRFGKLYADPKSWDWNPRPFSSLGYVFDFMPDHSEFFCASSLPYLRGQDDSKAPVYDFLWGCTPFWNENSQNDIEKAAKRGAEHITRGLDNLFFGCLTTHEQRIATLSIEEWNEILLHIEELTSNYDKIFESYDYIAQYARNRVKCCIKDASYNPSSRKIKCTLEGKTDMPLQLYVFTNEGQDIEYRFETVPAFTDSITISFQMVE